jgi:endonuclease G
MNKIFMIIGIMFLIPFGFSEQPSPHDVSTCNIQVPYGLPQSNKQHTSLICRGNYITLNDLDAKIPIYVAYTLTPAHAVGCLARKNQFASDVSLPKNQRATPEDYAKTGYDLGHLDPDGDNNFDAVAQQESFILSNISPQAPFLNRRGWKYLEDAIRNWAVSTGHSLTIYVGPIYDETDKTIGANKVVVPHAFYKIVIDDTTHHVMEFEYPQAEVNSEDFSQFIKNTTTHQGTMFPLPNDAIFDTKPWPITRAADELKKKECAKHAN